MQSIEWRPVVGYEGIYEVSNHGDVKRVLPKAGTRVGRHLKRSSKPSGHRYVTLVNADGNAKHFSVHRLVIIAFVGFGEPGQEVCHNNGDANDNRVENLRWDTHAANMQDAVNHGVLWSPKKTHCVHGHEFDLTNTAIATDGSKRCRTCARANSARSRSKQK